ncbi:GCN5-related N-acetyltransferase [mine drainage metagenome]|uniref:GCN5-related N-acetyltransferase n=1 Tax=mine drainage metagenome TaxID=410659 RepID=T0ZI38_9ZZZZ
MGRFEMFGRPTIAYWVARRFWRKGVATAALTAFLAERTERPLYARAAADNAASARVLAKCGFRPYGRERAFAEARGEEIEEQLFVLPTPDPSRADRP